MIVVPLPVLIFLLHSFHLSFVINENSALCILLSRITVSLTEIFSPMLFSQRECAQIKQDVMKETTAVSDISVSLLQEKKE